MTQHIESKPTIPKPSVTKQWQCWRCGEQLKDVILPFSRRQLCDHCNADQHVCRMCKHFDAAISGQCTEERADDVSNKETANFCDYFSPNPNAYKGAIQPRQTEAQSKLDALFGGDGVPKEEAEIKTNPVVDKADKARKALEDLFGDTDADS